jgi:hypothetical protein
LEVAPKGWSSTLPGLTNCIPASNPRTVDPTCNQGAAITLAGAYRGGGKTDWSLPSIGRLNALKDYTGYVRYDAYCTLCISGDVYWSSTNNGGTSLAHNFYYQRQEVPSSGSQANVRPVRAF